MSWGVYSRSTVPRPVNTGDSHFASVSASVPNRLSCPRAGKKAGENAKGRVSEFVHSDVRGELGPWLHVLSQQPTARNEVAFTQKHELLDLPLGAGVAI